MRPGSSSAYPCRRRVHRRSRPRSPTRSRHHVVVRRRPEPAVSRRGPQDDRVALTVLVTGATGYIGGRLIPRLLAEGHDVRAVTRDATRLRDVPWVDRVTVVAADVLDADAISAALQGVDVAYYLVHSIGSG